jgi:hypothetical protein
VEVEAKGTRARLRPETAAALAGSPIDDAVAMRSAQGSFVRAMAQAAGAEVNVLAQAEIVSLRVSFPARG